VKVQYLYCYLVLAVLADARSIDSGFISLCHEGPPLCPAGSMRPLKKGGKENGPNYHFYFWQNYITNLTTLNFKMHC
jgi:hypothetical protein